MRKLAFLVMVGVFVPAANGVVLLSVDGQSVSEKTIALGDTVVIGVTDSIGENGIWYTDFVSAHEGTFALSNPRPDDDPHILIVPPFEPPPWLFEITQEWPPEQTPVPGIIFEVDLTCLGEGDVWVELLDGATYSTIDSLVIHQVPEPMTVALLGLGGLLLRRKH